MKRTIAQVVQMSGGDDTGINRTEALLSGVSTDSRSVMPGQLFVPLVGETFDGHNFVSQAAARGAGATLWQRDHGPAPDNIPAIVVDDTLTALQRLAHEYRKQLDVRVIGVTGSNGKTTTKDMVAAILETTYRTHKTAGNLNNHIGLPLTLLGLDESTEMAVIEMGMSRRGEIELLTKLAEPEVAIITNIGEAHMQQLGSRDEIAKAKLEIISGLSGGGLLIYPGDEPLIARYLPSADQPKEMLRISFGTSDACDIYAVAILQDDEGMRFAINASPKSFFHIPILGKHNVTNALAAIAACKYMGVSEADIVGGLKELHVTGMRIERVNGANGVTVLNDAYNASPTSMRAAIELLHDLNGFRRKFVVLGDMLELGPDAPEYHAEIGRLLSSRLIDSVYAFGPLSRNLAEAAKTNFSPDRVFWFDDKRNLAEVLLRNVSAGDVVLVKASRGMRLEEVVRYVAQGSLG